tara:strand:- start:346 stop:654 length:309 start_codon:yes stop_codon:yes gene_type:complete
MIKQPIKGIKTMKKITLTGNIIDVTSTEMYNLEIKRQALELKFAVITEKIELIHDQIIDLEEDIKNDNKVSRLSDKQYNLEIKQGEIQDKIEILMNKMNITY